MLLLLPTQEMVKHLPADFAISHFTKLGKKVIYTSPIKALTNQKYNTFQEKYPEIEFGIITGDTTMNPGAQCLFVTTEILRNTLFKKKWLDTNEEKKTKLHWILILIQMNWERLYLMKFIILWIKNADLCGTNLL